MTSRTLESGQPSKRMAARFFYEHASSHFGKSPLVWTWWRSRILYRVVCTLLDNLDGVLPATMSPVHRCIPMHASCHRGLELMPSPQRSWEPVSRSCGTSARPQDDGYVPQAQRVRLPCSASALQRYCWGCCCVQPLLRRRSM